MITELRHAFFDAKVDRFRCNNIRHCPRYVLFRSTGLPHHTYPAIIDETFDRMTLSAQPDEMVKMIMQGHEYVQIPMREGRPALFRTVTSSSVSRRVTDGNPPEEDVLTALTFIAMSRAAHVYSAEIIYVQPRDLFSFKKTLPAFYRPFCVHVSEKGNFVNREKFRYPIQWGLDGVDGLLSYRARMMLPSQKPWTLDGKDDNDTITCTYCPYRLICKTMDTTKDYRLPRYSPSAKN